MLGRHCVMLFICILSFGGEPVTYAVSPTVSQGSLATFSLIN